MKAKKIENLQIEDLQEQRLKILEFTIPGTPETGRPKVV